MSNRSTSDKLDYVNALRGWAVLLVITSHVGYCIKELPYPALKLANFGWYGVQLFFLASAFTLLLSWHNDTRSFGVKSREFFIRRFFRIAPLYYLGALIYYIDKPPSTGFDLGQLLLSMGFVNAWWPTWVPTTPGWMVVPGGWSISAEFTFYMLFPLIATLFCTLSRAALFFVGSMGLIAFLNPWVSPIYTDMFGWTATNNYLYFWLPNQLPIFAMGFLVFFGLKVLPSGRLAPRVARTSIAVILLAVLVLAELYRSKFHFFHSLVDLPPMFYAAIIFMALFYVMSRGGGGVLNHPLLQRLGELCFSMYLLHFLVLEKCEHLLRAMVGDPTGVKAILACAVLWVVVVAITAAVSMLTYRHIEERGNAAARKIIKWLRARGEAATARGALGTTTT